MISVGDLDGICRERRNIGDNNSDFKEPHLMYDDLHMPRQMSYYRGDHIGRGSFEAVR